MQNQNQNQNQNQSQNQNQNQDLRSLPSAILLKNFKGLVQTERKITAEVIECIREIDRRRLYFEENFESLFAFLTKGLGYERAPAQRRIDAARLSGDIPELHNDLKSGDLNLSQVSLLAQCLRQKAKEEPEREIKTEEKRHLLEQVKSCNLDESAIVFAKGLNLEIKTLEKKRHQRDGSVRTEITFTKEEMAELERVKEVISHVAPNPSLSELTMYLVRDFLKRKDPLLQPLKKEKSSRPQQTSSATELQYVSKPLENSVKRSHNGERSDGRYIPRITYRAVFLRDRCCQWKTSNMNSPCGSKFQLQVDHVVPIWAGGGNTLKNLRLLCGVHNRLKYKQEANISTVSDQVKFYIFAKSG